MMYASKTPRDILPDPLPWWDKPLSAAIHLWRENFRQHNKPNPILVEFRECAGVQSFREDLQWWAECLRGDPYAWAADGKEWTPDQVDHARRVFSRLAVLS